MAEAANVISIPIRPGTTGEPVLRLQQALAMAGFETPVDGQFGVETEGALRTFQQSRGLSMSGMADHNTQVELGLTDGPALPGAGPQVIQPDLASRLAEAARMAQPGTRINYPEEAEGNGLFESGPAASNQRQAPGGMTVRQAGTLAQAPKFSIPVPFLLIAGVVVAVPLVIWLVDRFGSKPSFEDFEDEDGLDGEIALLEDKPKRKRKPRKKKAAKIEEPPEPAKPKPKRSRKKKIEEPPEEIEEEIEDEIEADADDGDDE